MNVFSLLLVFRNFNDFWFWNFNYNSFYHEYFEDDDGYCHISSDQLPLAINFTSALFIPSHQTNLQPNIDWSINEVGNTISEKSISSLRFKYEISSSVELRKSQICELANQPPPRVVAFHLYFFHFGVRLPLHHFLRYMLIYLNYAPAQLFTNV